MVHISVKVLGLGTLLMGIVGCLCLPLEGEVQERDVPSGSVGTVQPGEGFKTYQEQQLYLNGQTWLQNKSLYSVKQEENQWVYVVKGIEDKPLEKGDVKRVEAYYTFSIGKEEPFEATKLQVFTHPSLEQGIQVPYVQEMSQAEKKLIQEMFVALLSKGPDFSVRYETSWQAGFDQWQSFLQQAPQFSQYLTFDAQNYQQQFSSVLQPYSMSQEEVLPDVAQLKYEVDSTTTRNNHYFRINLPVQVLRDGYNRLYYNYDYLVGVRQNRIISIKFIKREQAD